MFKFRCKIANSLFSGTRKSVLALLFSHVGESFYLREIVRLIGHGMGAVQRELDNLTLGGIIKRERHGNQVHFSVNEECPIFFELKSLVLKTAGIAGTIQEALAKHEDRIDFTFIYGSFAKGEEEVVSDVDLMIIGDISSIEVAAVLGPLHDVLGREISPVTYTAEEFRAKLINRHHFIDSVTQGSKIFLIGNEDEFRKLGEERLAGKTQDQ